MIFHSQLNIVRILLGLVFIQLLSGSSNVNNDNKGISSTDSLFFYLNEIEEQSMEIRKSILNTTSKKTVNDEVEMLIQLYDVNKRSNVLMNQILIQIQIVIYPT